MKRLLILALSLLTGCGQLIAQPRPVMIEYEVQAPYVWVFNNGTVGFIQTADIETYEMVEFIGIPGGKAIKIKGPILLRLWSNGKMIIVTEKTFRIEGPFPSAVEKIPGRNVDECL